MPDEKHTYRITLSSLDWESPLEGIRQKFIIEGRKKLKLVEYLPTMPLHWCERGHLGYILEGRLEVEFESGVHVFCPGDGIVIPDGPGHRHRAKPLSDVVRVIFVE